MELSSSTMQSRSQAAIVQKEQKACEAANFDMKISSVSCWTLNSLNLKVRIVWNECVEEMDRNRAEQSPSFVPERLDRLE